MASGAQVDLAVAEITPVHLPAVVLLGAGYAAVPKWVQAEEQVTEEMEEMPETVSRVQPDSATTCAW